MNYFRVSILALLVVSVLSTVTIRVGETYSHAISQTQLTNYLNVLTGLNHQSLEINPQLRKIVFALRPSILNPIDKLTVLLVIDNNIQSISEGKVQLTNEIASFVSAYNQKIAFAIIRNVEQQAILQQIEKYTGERSVVVIIRENQSEILKLGQLLQNKGASSKRRLNEKQQAVIYPSQEATTDDAYLIKFFFSLLFIIVIIGIVVSIASNEGKKDTLLYAKFIADVNNGR